MSPAEEARIGVDVGGTHTDVTAIVGERIERGKALTTYDDFGRGVMEAVAVAAAAHGLGTEELLGRCRLFVNGTTVVTNSITTLTGSRVGVLVTAGMKDTFRFAGGPRLALFDDHLQHNAPDLFDRAAVAEIDERVDSTGAVLAPVRPEQVLTEAERLIEEQDVEAIAICFLNSFLNPANEAAAAELLAEAHPDRFFTASHAAIPVRGENRRWTTAVLNCFVQRRALEYLESLSARLRTAGLQRGVVFFQGLGGGISLERASQYPLALLGSGPAAGAVGANALARRMGVENVLLGDMGGTSFDTGIIVGNEIHIERDVNIGLLQTGVKIVDVTSVGAGGGSIAWVGDRGVPQVGPQSATADPGPAAYGRGGTAPTVTDAMVALGVIDPDDYLGGRFKLHRDRAEAALAETLGDRFGWSAQEAAVAIHDLAVVNMADAVREVSIGKGHDPRDFLFLAYGGTLPMFAVQIAERLGISRVVIPQNSSVFCALGLLSADFVMRYDRTVDWDLARGDLVDPVNAAAAEMVEQGRSEMRAEGFSDEEIEVALSGDFRFLGQPYELSIPLPDRPLEGADAAGLASDFVALYERTYGAGTAWKGVPVQLLTLTVTVSGRRAETASAVATAAPGGASEAPPRTRSVYLPSEGEEREIPVLAEAGFGAGDELAGPAIVDATDTTIFIPPGATARRDEYLNYVLSTEGAAA